MMFTIMFLCIFLTIINSDKKQDEKIDNRPRKGLIICRVSTAEQKKGTSLETQEAWAKRKASEMNVPTIPPIKKDISGEIFPKENYDTILDIVKKEKITHLFVYSFDRLSRSFPYGVMLVHSLWENDVQIITSTLEPDKNKHSHRMQVWLSLFFAELEHGGINERTSRGMIAKFQKGIWPWEEPPWGYERIDLKLRIKPGFEEIIKFIFETFIKIRDYTKTAQFTNEKYKEIIKKKLKLYDIKNIITCKKYLGYFSWSGLDIGKDGVENEPYTEMIAIDKETFEKAQQIVNEKTKGHTRGVFNLPPSIEGWMETYGPGYVIEKLSNLLICCPKCRSINLAKEGSQIVNGTSVNLYVCKKDNYHFRFPSGKQIKHFRRLHPLRCMNCGEVDHFKINDSQLTDFHQVVCKECGNMVLVKKSDNLFPIDVGNKKKDKILKSKDKSEKKLKKNDAGKNFRLTS